MTSTRFLLLAWVLTLETLVDSFAPAKNQAELEIARTSSTFVEESSSVVTNRRRDFVISTCAVLPFLFPTAALADNEFATSAGRRGCQTTSDPSKVRIQKHPVVCLTGKVVSPLTIAYFPCRPL